MWHWSSDVDRVREGRDGKFTMELPCSSRDLAHGSAHADEDFCCTMTLVPDHATGSGVPYIAVPPQWRPEMTMYHSTDYHQSICCWFPASVCLWTRPGGN